MRNVEILGKPKYRPIKVQLPGQLNLLNQLKSKQESPTLTYSDLVYERDVIDEYLATNQDI